MYMRAFHDILVPVDFSFNTEVAVQKALELADGQALRLHLLHVRKGVEPQDGRDARYYEELATWKEGLEEREGRVEVKPLLLHARSVQEGIRQAACTTGADLVVIAKKRELHWYSLFPDVMPMRLAEQTKVPVLTVRPGAMHSRVRIVVVPISDQLPQRKMETLEILSRRGGRIHVHLVTHIDQNGPSPYSAAALLDLYQWLQKRLRCPIEYSVVHGSNKARSILDYAHRVEADLLLLHPDGESRIGWWDRHISDVLSPRSKVQVLAVHPNHSLT